MKTHPPRLLLGATVAALAFVLVACNKAPEPPPPTPASTGTVGTQIDDTVITSNVKTALLAEPDIKSLDISVDTVKGVVTLTGLVDNQSQIDQAAMVASRTSGTTSVKNDLKVKP
jgi:hyperosmotically inducible periplasmic protein